jgi:hypothetical protein
MSQILWVLAYQNKMAVSNWPYFHSQSKKQNSAAQSKTSSKAVQRFPCNAYQQVLDNSGSLSKRSQQQDAVGE